MLGINNRDLDDFSVDIERTLRAAGATSRRARPSSPSPASRRASSSTSSSASGVDAVLIGETLMRAPDIEAAVPRARPAAARRTLIATSRSAASPGSRTPSSPSSWAPGRSGFILWPRSPRAADPAVAAGIAARAAAPRRARRRVRQRAARRVAQLADALGLTLVQLHGDEGPAFCAEVARRTGAKVIKAVADAPRAPTSRPSSASTPTSTCSTPTSAGCAAAPGETWDWSCSPRAGAEGAG